MTQVGAARPEAGLWHHFVSLGETANRPAAPAPAAAAIAAPALPSLRNAAFAPAAARFPGASLLAMVRPTKDNTKYSDVWKKVRDAEDAPLKAHDLDELRAHLGIDATWPGRPQLKALVEALERQGLATPHALTYIEKMSKKHGSGVMEQVAARLTIYLASFPTPGDEQKGVVANALHDLAYPSDIDQRNRKTCTTAAIQMKLAIERPQQYVEMLTRLARNKAYTMPNGDELKPNNTWRNDGSDKRSYSSRIIENALMGEGKKFFNFDTYDSAKDPSGLDSGNYTSIMQKLFGDPDYDVDGLMSRNSTLYQYVEDDIARGRTVVASFKSHAFLVVGIDKSVSPPLVYMNSWGEQYTMTVDQFIEHLDDVTTVDDPGKDNRKTPAGSRVILGDTDD